MFCNLPKSQLTLSLLFTWEVRDGGLIHTPCPEPGSTCEFGIRRVVVACKSSQTWPSPMVPPNQHNVRSVVGFRTVPVHPILECLSSVLYRGKKPKLPSLTPFLFLHMKVVAFSWTENYSLIELHFHRYFGIRAFKQMYALGISPPYSGDNVLIILTEARPCCVM